jgi:hypothetical protein
LLSRTGVTDGLIGERVKRLESTTGLFDDIFLSWSMPADLAQRTPISEREWNDAPVPVGLEKPNWQELNSGSVFGDVQHADLAVSVAAALQRMRCGSDGVESELDEEFRSPVAKVLDPHLYLTGRFYEAPIVAAILRATHRHDLRSPTNEHTLKKSVEEHLLNAPSSTQLRSELVLATARRLLPKLSRINPESFDGQAETSVAQALAEITSPR